MQLRICNFQGWIVAWSCSQNNIEPHEAVPEVSKGKVHITENKHVLIEIDCDFLNTFHSISHATLSWCWLNDAVQRTTYSVLLQYCSVLHSTTPVLICTTQYYKVLYSSTTLYYTELLQYYSVLQSTTSVLLCTTKFYSVLHRTTPVLLCTTKHYSCTTKYWSCTTLY